MTSDEAERLGRRAHLPADCPVHLAQRGRTRVLGSVFANPPVPDLPILVDEDTRPDGARCRPRIPVAHAVAIGHLAASIGDERVAEVETLYKSTVGSGVGPTDADDL